MIPPASNVHLRYQLGVRLAGNAPVPFQLPAARMPQAGMGIASLVLAVISLLSILLMGIVIVAAHRTFPHTAEEIDSTPFLYMLGGWVFVDFLLNICGIVFGIGGLRQANRRHSMATIGLCLNIAVPLGTLFLSLLMVLMANAPPQESSTITRTGPGSDGSPTVTAVATFGCIVIGGILVTRLSNKRRGKMTGSVPQLNSILCQRCKKPMPRDSKFCRRCGSDLQLGGNIRE